MPYRLHPEESDGTNRGGNRVPAACPKLLARRVSTSRSDASPRPTPSVRRPSYPHRTPRKFILGRSLRIWVQLRSKTWSAWVPPDAAPATTIREVRLRRFVGFAERANIHRTYISSVERFGAPTRSSRTRHAPLPHSKRAAGNSRARVILLSTSQPGRLAWTQNPLPAKVLNPPAKS
jgi:hypothetical protein